MVSLDPLSHLLGPGPVILQFIRLISPPPPHTHTHSNSLLLVYNPRLLRVWGPISLIIIIITGDKKTDRGQLTISKYGTNSEHVRHQQPLCY